MKLTSTSGGLWSLDVLDKGAPLPPPYCTLAFSQTAVQRLRLSITEQQNLGISQDNLNATQCSLPSNTTQDDLGPSYS